MLNLPEGSLPHIPHADVELYDGESLGLAIGPRTPRNKSMFILKEFTKFRYLGALRKPMRHLSILEYRGGQVCVTLSFKNLNSILTLRFN